MKLSDCDFSHELDFKFQIPREFDDFRLNIGCRYGFLSVLCMARAQKSVWQRSWPKKPERTLGWVYPV